MLAITCNDSIDGLSPNRKTFIGLLEGSSNKLDIRLFFDTQYTANGPFFKKVTPKTKVVDIVNSGAQE